MFYLVNTTTGFLAHKDSKGERDGLTTVSCIDAAFFDTFGEASNFSQNFGPDWVVDSYED